MTAEEELKEDIDLDQLEKEGWTIYRMDWDNMPDYVEQGGIHKMLFR